MQPVRFLPSLTIGALVIVGLAACSSGSQPGWTYAPPPTATVAPSTAPGASSAPSAAAPSAVPSAAAPSAAPSAAAPSAAPSAAAPSASASAATGGTTVLSEGAKNVQFTVQKLEAPAGQPFQIAFDNQDASIQHDVQISDATGAIVFDGDVVTGVAQATYNVNALQAGVYKFVCRIHPTAMIGELTVK